MFVGHSFGEAPAQIEHIVGIDILAQIIAFAHPGYRLQDFGLHLVIHLAT